MYKKSRGERKEAKEFKYALLFTKKSVLNPKDEACQNLFLIVNFFSFTKNLKQYHFLPPGVAYTTDPSHNPFT